MKKLLLFFLIPFLNTVTVFSQIDNINWDLYSSQNKNKCWGSGPTYYTTRKLSVYENMSTQSAISGDIPSGVAVIVTNSFFGDSGWWEVCYEGLTGNVLKASLTRKEPTQNTTTTQSESNNTSISSSDADTDVGFEPFLGATKSAANFRNAPSMNSSVIRELQAGAQLYIYSKQDANGFYKAIDIKTGKIGWVAKGLVKWTGEATVNYSGAFQSTGSSTTYNSEVTIRNKSSYTITLVVGSETFYLSPNSTDIKSISPERKYYIATAPGVIPSSGYQTFSSYQGYEWEFWVETRTR